MELFLYLIPVAVIAAVIYYIQTRRKAPAPVVAPEVDYRGIVRTEDRRRLIQGTESVEELERAAEAWVSTGMSKDGLLYAEVLERKQQLTGSLSDIEAMRVRRAKQAREEGAKLPPIRGRGRM